MEPTSAAGLSLSKIIIGVVIVAAVGGGALVLTGKKGTEKSAVTDGSPEKIEQAQAKVTFKDLLAKGGSSKCTFTDSNDLNESSGTFFMSEGKAREDFVTTIKSGPGAGTTMNSHMILNGDSMLTWDESTGQGMKMSLANMESANAEHQGKQTGEQQTATQFNNAYDYHCEAWSADTSVFVAPASVKFMDMSDMMNGMNDMKSMVPANMPGKAIPPAAGRVQTNTSLETSNAAQCAMCDQAGPGRDQCRAALGCK